MVLTAQQARETAHGARPALSTSAQLILDTILRRVTVAARKNLFGVALHYMPSEEVAAELVRRGFEIVRRPRVERYDRFNTLMLSWREPVREA